MSGAQGRRGASGKCQTHSGPQHHIEQDHVGAVLVGEGKALQAVQHRERPGSRAGRGSRR